MKLDPPTKNWSGIRPATVIQTGVRPRERRRLFRTMSLLRKLSDTPVFLEQWLHAPACIGAILPSSASLARAMARWIRADPAGLVVELGPGTGAVTEEILARGIAPDRLVAIETTPALVRLLRRRFPGARIIQGDARELLRLLQQHLATAHPTVSSVVSSLPLRQFPRADRQSLARQIHLVLPPGGHWIQYTYHLNNGHLPGDPRFRTIHSDVVWWNVPPARVLVFEK